MSRMFGLFKRRKYPVFLGKVKSGDIIAPIFGQKDAFVFKGDDSDVDDDCYVIKGLKILDDGRISSSETTINLGKKSEVVPHVLRVGRAKKISVVKGMTIRKILEVKSRVYVNDIIKEFEGLFVVEELNKKVVTARKLAKKGNGYIYTLNGNLLHLKKDPGISYSVAGNMDRRFIFKLP